MKVVYNACYGGFGISDAGMMRYAEIKGIKLYPEPNRLFTMFWTSPQIEERQRDSISHRDIARNDPALVQMVEELGQAANGHFAELKITDVPSGERYRIDEYDGSEEVMTVDDYDWQIAT